MTIKKSNPFYAWFFPLLLLTSVITGGLAGYFFNDKVLVLKPVGAIFLNLLLTSIVPLIFFSVSSAIAGTGSTKTLGRILLIAGAVFLITGAIASIYALIIVKLFPPATGVELSLTNSVTTSGGNLSDQIVSMFSVSDFTQLFSHQHILALLVFSILVGLATIENRSFAQFLKAGEQVFMRVFTLIMYLAPLGFFAYFAVLVAELGPKLMGSYLRVSVLYYVAASLYFLIAYSAYACLTGQKQGIKNFWSHIFLPLITSLATCSSAASIPANLEASKAMGVPAEIRETVIPLGTILHKEGSIIGGIFKIAFLFGIFHMDFSGGLVLASAFLVSLLVGTVMGAIPSGGMLGELLILNVYGFPPSVLIAVAAISILIDPLATMLNVTGNTVSSLLVARWMAKTSQEPPADVLQQ